MAKIQVKRGIEANLGNITLTDGEFAVTTDTKKLYVGVAGVKICLGGASSLGDMLKSIYDTNNDGIVDNTDKLDGKHASDFAPAGFGLGVPLSGVSISNSNLAMTTGMYYALESDTNKPTGVNDGSLFVMAYSSIWINQIYLDWRTNKIYRRMCSNGIWSNWIELLTTKRQTTWNDLKGV